MRVAGRIALVAWFVILTVGLAGLLARHLLALPTPSKTAQLGRRLLALESPRSSWLAVHVLSSTCQCSMRVVTHLLDTDRPAGWHELVLWVGDIEPPAALVSGFDVRRIGAAELASYGIEGAPLLIAVRPDGDVRYAGGYSERKQGPVLHDLDILAAARGSDEIPTLPLFGCATSERLQAALANLPTP